MSTDEAIPASTPPRTITAAPTGFAAALEGLQPPNEISWREATKAAHADYLKACHAAGQTRHILDVIRITLEAAVDRFREQTGVDWTTTASPHP